MVFSELLTRLHLPQFRYSPLGLRDGILAQMMSEYDISPGVRKRIASERENTLAKMTAHYSVDMRYARRVRELTAELFAGLRPVHDLPDEYADWLAAAAMLQEIGSFINRAGRHRHAYYIIAHSEMFGYTIRQRHIVAAIARYVGNSRPTPESRPDARSAHGGPVARPQSRAVAALGAGAGAGPARHGNRRAHPRGDLAAWSCC